MKFDGLLEEVRAGLESGASEPVDQLSADGVVWLGLVPEWSIALAESVGFPTGDRFPEIASWVREAERLGICRVSAAQPYSGDDSPRFWMIESKTTSTLRPALVQIDDPVALARSVAGAVGSQIESARRVWTESLRPWAELAASSPYDAGDRLLAEVRRFVAFGDLQTTNRWIIAAERLEPIMGADLGSALRRARRHVALHHRRRYDESVLREYIARPDLVEPFEALLASESIWALHYLGDGGVGKTSLLRTLTAQRSRPSAEQLLFARVDFDHVSPDYPWRRPAQLLSLLADELEMAALSADQERSLADFRRSERRSREVGSAAESAASLDSSEFVLALDDFARLLRRLPGRAVLVLDTCEELAKYHAPDEPVAAVDFTFAILERLHERVPSMRVVFAGRRLLASSGADTVGWNEFERDRSRAPAQRRTYLDLCCVRGFTTEQAEEFLHVKKSVGSGPVSDAILSVTREDDGTGVARHNPFDVAMYATWAHDDPELDADVIRGDDGVRYVERRIVARLEAELSDVIPVLVALNGRATSDLIALALGSQTRASEMHARLRLQEWIDPSATWMGEVLVVQRRLLVRFRRFVETSNHGSPRAVLRGIEERLRTGLDDSLRVRPSELSPTTAAIAFGVLSSEQARQHWSALEAKAEEHDEWNEIQRLASHLAADPEDGGLPAAAVDVRSMVTETHARATARTGGGRRRIVDRLASAEPASAESLPPPVGLAVPTTAPVAALVAEAGSAGVTDAAAVARRNMFGFVRTYRDPPSGIDPLAGQFVTDFESVLDEAAREEIEVTPIGEVVEALEHRAPEIFVPAGHLEELGAFLLALVARWRLMTGDVARAMPEFARAEACLTVARPRNDGMPIGWIRPPYPVDRVRLMIVEARYAHGPPVLDATTTEWFQQACRRGSTIDGNRLASRILIAASESGDRSNAELRPVTDHLVGPTTWDLALHDRVPPLFAGVAIADAARGRQDDARRSLRSYKSSYGSSNERITRVIELVELRLAIADGWNPGDRVHSLLGVEDERSTLAATWIAINRPQKWTSPTALDPHEGWRLFGSARVAADLVPRLEAAYQSSRGVRREELRIDLLEATLLGARVRVADALDDDPQSGPGHGLAVFDSATWERRARCELRRAALAGDSTVVPKSRRASELAMEEASLVAARLPDTSARLFDFARTGFERMTDRSSRRVVELRSQLDNIASSRSPEEIVRRMLRWARPALPFVGFVVAFLAMGGVFSWTSSPEPDGVAQFTVGVAVIAFYVAVAWLVYGRRFHRGLLSMLPLPGRWPYWISWRVRMRSHGPAEVTLVRAARYSGVKSPVFRWLLVLPQVYSLPFESLWKMVLKWRLTPWNFSLLPRVEPGGGVNHAPPEAWWLRAQALRNAVCVEIASSHGNEDQQIEREFAFRFGLSPETSKMVFFRRAVIDEAHVVHPTRRAVRRAGAHIVAPAPIGRPIAAAWAEVGVVPRSTGGDRSALAEITAASSVHVVGEPVETPLGWVIESGLERASDKITPERSNAMLFGGHSITRDEAPRLVVLQPTPAIEVNGIGDAREVVGCRHVASGLREQGCPVVIVLPVLSTKISVELAETLAGAVADHHLDRLRLIDVSIALRSFLAERLTGLVDAGKVRAIVSDFTIYTNR